MAAPLHISFADIALARESERAPSPLALRWYAVGSADNVKKCFMKNLLGQESSHRLGNGNDSEVPSSKLRHYQRCVSRAQNKLVCLAEMEQRQ